MHSVETLAVALRAFRRHRSLTDLGHYTGILSLQGLARLAVTTGDEALLEEARGIVRRFMAREIEVKGCNYENYRCGGNGAAYLLRHGLMPEVGEQVRQFVDQTLHEAPRDRRGLVCLWRCPEEERVFIDQAFAVCPFLVHAGAALDDQAALDDAVAQGVGMYELLLDEACGLLHQGVNFAGPGSISEDHWSRGNGWGILALAELVDGLPAGDPRRERVVGPLASLVAACLRYQDADGVWHQELTDHDSYVETSGTGLILFAIGVACEHGLVGEEGRAAFERGLRGYLPYLAVDGSVHNTCTGCLCPDGGKLPAYLQRAWKLNDTHAFGPVTLAFGQALRLGIDRVACD